MKFARDEKLVGALDEWDDYCDVVTNSERKFFRLRASEKSYFAELFLQAPGKSIAEREHYVFASDDWKVFAEGLAEAHSLYNHEIRKLEVKQKDYESEYLVFKRTP